MYNIITIERQYASGGRKTGELLAEKLNMNCYNQEILDLAAKKLNISPKNVEHLEEIATNSFANAVDMLTNFEWKDQFGDKLFYAESEIIKELASKGNCIIVGRCAGNILSGKRNLLNVFIYADEKSRIKRATEEYGIALKDAHSELARNDKRRTAFYNMRSGKKWLSMDTYDLCLNSAAFGIEGCVEILEDVVRRK